VTVTSEPGKGSVFTVRLPAHADTDHVCTWQNRTCAPKQVFGFRPQADIGAVELSSPSVP
jgi:hypothetical protein